MRQWELCDSGIELFKVGTAKLSVDSRNILLHFLTRLNGQKRTVVFIRLSGMVWSVPFLTRLNGQKRTMVLIRLSVMV